MIARIWERHDYTTLTPGVLSDRLTAVAMEPARRERILARTRGIIRANLPELEGWLLDQPALRYVRPVAGAIAFAEVDLPMPTREIVERIRLDRSVLLVPGEMFGIDNGIRFGFGYRHPAHPQGPRARGRDSGIPRRVPRLTPGHPYPRRRAYAPTLTCSDGSRDGH